jgi:uncharacterized membrane protein YfcA
VPWILLGGAVFLFKNWKIKKNHQQKLFGKMLPLFGFLLGLFAGLGGAPSAFVILILALALDFKMHCAIVNTRLIELVGNAVVVASYLF